METNIRADLIEYAETLPEGHHLREIALRTALELGKQNPFNRIKPKERFRQIKVTSDKGHKYQSLDEACAKKQISLMEVRIEINYALAKFGLLMA